MRMKALNVAPMPRARRNRLALVAIAGALLSTTAAVAGVLLMNAGGGPVLVAVTGYETNAPQTVMNDLRSDETEAPSTLQTPEPVEVQPTVNLSASQTDGALRWFNGRPIRPAGTMTMIVTAYSPDAQSCGKWADGITASGYSVWTNGMNLVAADESILPFGSLVSIPGYDSGDVVPVLDRGGAIKGHRLDVLYPTHERAMQWGVQELEVTVWEYADGKPNGFRQNHRRR